jgi:hypothetical protein
VTWLLAILQPGLSTSATVGRPTVAARPGRHQECGFQFHEHMLLTVQAINRLRQAFSEKML